MYLKSFLYIFHYTHSFFLYVSTIHYTTIYFISTISTESSAIFCRFLHFCRFLSLILFSNSNEKSFINRRWFSFYFSSHLSSALSSCFTIFLIVLFCSLPADRVLSYFFSSVKNIPAKTYIFYYLSFMKELTSLVSVS